MDCVADLSFCAGWFQPSQSHAAGEQLLKAHLAGDVNLVCPSIWHYEVLNLLSTAVRRGTLAPEQADTGVELLNALQVRAEELHSGTLRKRVHHFARQFKLSAYDAAYLEVADRLQAPLLTRDNDLMAAARQRTLRTTLPK